VVVKALEWQVDAEVAGRVKRLRNEDVNARKAVAAAF